ncbi:MAG: hypothetical protein HOW73_47980 [Polyangiaceae bacterium]|nr:hypothetical protein [Polyangiaceae bacterium]
MNTFVQDFGAELERILWPTVAVSALVAAVLLLAWWGSDWRERRRIAMVLAKYERRKP